MADLSDHGDVTLDPQTARRVEKLGQQQNQHEPNLAQKGPQMAATVDPTDAVARPILPADTVVQARGDTAPGPEVTIDSHLLKGAQAEDDGFETTTDTTYSPVAGYQILGELGRGGMGVVYKARHTGLNRVVALKMLLAGAHASGEQLARFNIEAEAVARLQHPNIVQIYDVGEQDGLPYFSLEYVDGRSLGHHFGGNPQSPRHAAQLIMVLARAVHCAHENGIVHRDLKPANVLMTSTGVPKITDFGLAKRLEGDSSHTKSGTLMGTPSYMAPEQARGDVRNVGPSADVYALGAILYEALTGRPPFVSANVMDTVMQVLRNEPVRPSQLRGKVPRDLETICLRCLQKEAGRRYPSAGALADDLDRYLAGEPIQARPAGTLERGWRWCRRNPRVAVLVATIFVLLVAGIIGSSVAAVTIAQERNQKEEERRAADSARTLAENRKKEADTANEQAQKNAKEALKQSQLALESLRTLIREVQKEIGDSPNLQPLKLKLLEIALEGLDKVAAGDENSRLLGQTTAGAYMQMGQLFHTLGQSEKAFAQYEKCHHIIQALAERDPDGDVAQANLAATFTVLGQMSLELRRDAKASLNYYEKALAIRQKLVAGKLSDKLSPTKIKQDLAESYIRLGVTYLRLGEPEKGRASFDQALALRQALADADGKDPELKLDVARSLNALAEVEFRAGHWDAAAARFAEALAICERVEQGQPANPRFQWELANTLGNFGVFDVRTGNFDAGKQHYTRYLALMQKLVEQQPKVALYQRYLGLANYRMATLAARLHDSATAERCNRACLDIRERLAAEDRVNEGRQRELMLVLPRVRKHVQAAEMAAKFVTTPSVDAEVLVEAAQCLAQCAASAADEPDLSISYTNRAVEALQQALAKGYKDVVFLRTDPDLDQLRQHPGFQALVAQFK